MPVAGDDWIQTLKGNAFQLFDQEGNIFDVEEIAHALAMQCRFNGHVKHFYSVAEHSVRVSRVLSDAGESPAVCFAGLMHDAAEAYIGDCVRPLKKYLMAFQDIEHNIEHHIADVFELDFPLPSVVKKADNTMLHIERLCLLADPPRPWIRYGAPIPNSQMINGETTWRAAKGEFLYQYGLLNEQRKNPT